MMTGPGFLSEVGYRRVALKRRATGVKRYALLEREIGEQKLGFVCSRLAGGLAARRSHELVVQ
jgi:hypothetical protein